MDVSTIISYQSEGLFVQATRPTFNTVQVTWSGTFSHREEPKDLVGFLRDHTTHNGEKIENIELHFEKLTRIRSGMITFLLRAIKDLQTDRTRVTLSYSDRGFQAKIFGVFQRSLEELVRSQPNKAKELQFHKVAA